MADYLFNYLHTYTWWQGVLSLLKYGYVPMVLLLLVLYISKQRRTLAIQLLELVNWISLACTILIIFDTTISSFYSILHGGRSNPTFIPKVWTGPLYYVYKCLQIFKWAPFLFLVPKWRTTFWLPLAIIILGYPNDYTTFASTVISDINNGIATTNYYLAFALKYTIGFLLYGIVLAVVYWGRGKLASGNLVKQ